MEIQSHTRTHPFMDRMDDDGLGEELAGSRRDLQERGMECNSIAWPYGKWNERTLQAAERAGYRGTFLGDMEWELRHHRDPMRITRVGVDAQQGVFGLAFQLGAGYDLWVLLKGWRKRRGESTPDSGD